jgi:hypothetical protein
MTCAAISSNDSAGFIVTNYNWAAGKTEDVIHDVSDPNTGLALHTSGDESTDHGNSDFQGITDDPIACEPI